MAPKFLAGDIVVGRAIKSGEEKSAHQKYCLIKLGPDKYVVRKVIYGKDGLLLLALDDRLPSFTLKSSSKIYLVTWHMIQQ
ncbi:MAG TPA: hypothetical protein VEL47_00440, partial [Myxococcota bacterium]|nr:hypothetical protein [Myxococcota bacterium]